MPYTFLFIGGNSGIGFATARLLRSQGVSLEAAARNPGPLAELDIPVQTFDAASPSSLDLPPVLDGLVYFTGSITLKPFHRLTIADFLEELQVNLLGAVSAIQSALPALMAAPSPSVILFSSVAVVQGLPFHASIAALVAFFLSDPARFITGQILRPGGGLSSIRAF